ncbi:MAG: hypothetical protein DHS20C18_27190 [Saprospiraceae bacterium]|nr:MAG: hypothetical protein DHS20C18_27190 [Saprospiraceae bacterium]
MYSVMAIMVLSTMAMASNTAPTFRVTEVSNAKKVRLEVISTDTKANMQIIDENEVVLFDQIVEHTFFKTLNLENLPNGDYRLVLTTTTRIITQPFHLEANKAVVNEDFRKEYFLPIIRQNEDFVDVSVLNKQLANVEVSIRNESGEEIFSEIFRNQLKVERRYDVSTLERGIYTLRMKTSAKTIYKELMIK